jgi:hypothetical protein
MADFGLSISAPGTNVNTTAKNNLLLNSNYPFYKIDTQNKNGFRTTFISIITDPPEPSGAGYQFTILHQYPHNYKYIPAIQALFYGKVTPAGTTFTQKYFFDSGTIAAHTAFDEALLFAYADATNVYIICRKYKDSSSGGLANVLSGSFYQITIYSPVEDVGST